MVKSISSNMEFIDLLNKQKSDLKNPEYVHNLYREIVTGEVSEDAERLFQYFLHFEPDEIHMTRLKDLLTQNPHIIDELNKDLKIYLMTFLYFCMRTEEPCYSNSVKILAAIIYVQLITLSEEKFFREMMMKTVLKVLVHPTDKNRLCGSLVQALKKYVIEENEITSRLNIGVICGSISVLIMYKTKEEIHDFGDSSLLGICYQSLKEIILNCNIETHNIAALSCLFNPFKYSYYKNRHVPDLQHDCPIVVKNFQNFIKRCLLPEFDAEKYTAYLEAFTHTWHLPDFAYYDEAVLYMNDLNKCYCAELLRKLGLYLLSGKHEKYHVNLLNLLYSALSNLHPMADDEKLQVLYESALTNNIILCQDSSKCSQKAVEILSKICLLNNFVVTTAIGNFVNKQPRELICLENLIKIFKESIETRWASGTRNKQVTIIVCVMLSNVNLVNSKLTYEILHTLCWDATPFSLKPCMLVLEELFFKMRLKKENAICTQILRIFVKMAMHTDTTSKEYLKALFTDLFKPKIINNIEYSNDHYLSVLLNNDIDLDLLFAKCAQENLIKDDHIEFLINTMTYEDDLKLKLLALLVKNKCYKEIKKVTQFILGNFRKLMLHENTKYVLFIYNQILNWKTSYTDNELSEIEAIYSNLCDAILCQIIPMDVLQNAFDCFRKSREIMNITDEEILNQIHIKYFKILEKTEFTPLDVNELLYVSEYILRNRSLPAPEYVEKILKMTEKESMIKIQAEQPLVWFPLLQLASAFALLNKKHVDHIISVLKSSLNDKTLEDAIKITLLKILHMLCFEITHDFGDLIEFCFYELINGETVLKKLVATFIEQLIDEDYLKLSSDQYFAFVALLGLPEANILMQELLSRRFIHAQFPVISKYFVTFIIYENLFRHPTYPISKALQATIVKIKPYIISSQDIHQYLFQHLPNKSKINILMEICSILEDYMNSKLRIDCNFTHILEQFLFIFKLTATVDQESVKDLYESGMKVVEKEILKNSRTSEDATLSLEGQKQIISTTITILKLLFFNAIDIIIRSTREKLFDIIICWTLHFRSNIIFEVSTSGNAEVKKYYSRLVKFYTKHKEHLINTDK